MGGGTGGPDRLVGWPWRLLLKNLLCFATLKILCNACCPCTSKERDIDIPPAAKKSDALFVMPGSVNQLYQISRDNEDFINVRTYVKDTSAPISPSRSCFHKSRSLESCSHILKADIPGMINSQPIWFHEIGSGLSTVDAQQFYHAISGQFEKSRSVSHVGAKTFTLLQSGWGLITATNKTWISQSLQMHRMQCTFLLSFLRALWAASETAPLSLNK